MQTHTHTKKKEEVDKRQFVRSIEKTRVKKRERKERKRQSEEKDAKMEERGGKESQLG